MAIQLIQLPSISQASDSSAIGLRDFSERFHSSLRERVGERVGGEDGGGRTPMRDIVVATSEHGVEFPKYQIRKRKLKAEHTSLTIFRNSFAKRGTQLSPVLREMW